MCLNMIWKNGSCWWYVFCENFVSTLALVDTPSCISSKRNNNVWMPFVSIFRTEFVAIFGHHKMQKVQRMLECLHCCVKSRESLGKIYFQLQINYTSKSRFSRYWKMIKLRVHDMRTNWNSRSRKYFFLCTLALNEINYLVGQQRTNSNGPLHCAVGERAIISLY